MAFCIALAFSFAVVAAACGGSSDETHESTSSTLAPTTTPAASSTTTTAAPTATTTTTRSRPALTVAGSELIFSVDGVAIIHGRTDRSVNVTVGGVAAPTHTDPDGTTGFTAELVLRPGEHAVDVVATDDAGLRATTTLTVVVGPSLERQLAFVGSIDSGDETIVADYAEWLTGEEALLAAREDGWIGQDQELDNDFYIRNRNPRLRTLPMAEEAAIVLYACYPDEGPCLTLEAVDRDTWSSLLSDPEAGYELVGWAWYGSGYSPYWLIIDDGLVVQVSEQYVS
jgi:hypothetical protein